MPSALPLTPGTGPFKILIIGASYAGLSAALNLVDLCANLPPRCGPAPPSLPPPLKVVPNNIAIEITLLDPRDGFYHTIGSPLALADEAYAAKAWVKYGDIPALRGETRVRCVQGEVKGVDMARKVARFVPAVGGRGGGDSEGMVELAYDYLVAASGLERQWPVVPRARWRKGYLFEVEEHLQGMVRGPGGYGVCVVGGGAVGIEMAAELKMVNPELNVTLVHSQERLLSAEPLPEEVGETALELLREAGVEVKLGVRLEGTEEVVDAEGRGCTKVRLGNRETMVVDKVVMAVSRAVPTTGYLPRAVVDGEGYVRVQADLTMASDVPHTADHFAIGDIAKWSGIKRCGAAMHMGYLAAHNIHQLMQQRLTNAVPEFVKLDEVPPMIGLAVGKKAVAYWPEGGVTSGEDVLKNFFGDDLGFSICWNYLRLGGEKPAV